MYGSDDEMLMHAVSGREIAARFRQQIVLATLLGSGEKEGRKSKGTEKPKVKKKLNTKCILDNPDDKSDVILEVEGKQLHANRALLGHFSPFFHNLFFTNFAGKQESNVPLPGKKYAEMSLFFNVLLAQCPSSRGLMSDKDLLPLLKLAEEYEADQIKTRCQYYMGERLLHHHTVMKRKNPEERRTYISARETEPDQDWIKRLTHYLRMCDQFNLPRYRLEIIHLLVKEIRTLDKDLVKVNDYTLLSAESKVALLEELCRKRDPTQQDNRDPYSGSSGYRFRDDDSDHYD